MKTVFLSLAALLLLSAPAQAVEMQDNEEASVELLDTTANWGIGGHDDDGDRYDYWYKCKARPKKGHGSFWGEGSTKFEAKREALEECYEDTHGHCYIDFCKKFRKH